MVVAKKGILSIEEKFLPGEGENQTPAQIPAEAIELVKKVLQDAYKVIGCAGYARIDCFYQDKQHSPNGKARVIILEFNTLPGMTPATCIFHQAAECGMRPMEFIDKIIELGFANHAEKVRKKVLKQCAGAEIEAEVLSTEPGCQEKNCGNKSKDCIFQEKIVSLF